MMYIGPPDHLARHEIFVNHLNKLPTSPDHPIDIDELVRKTEGYSGAEIVAVCREASLSALDENIQSMFIFMRHFLQAIRKITPRITQEMLQFYANFSNSSKLLSI
jgi:AAA family ATPase